MLKRGAFAIGFMGLGALLGVGASAVAGSPSGEGGRYGHLGRILGIYEGLDLNPAQQKQMAEIKGDLKEEFKTGMQERLEEGRETVDLIKADKLDRKLVHQRIDNRAKDRLEVAHDLADQLMDLHESLNASQKQELVTRLEQGLERAEEHMKKGPPARR
jgi:Spy/CpxP family protein refolding chaperone